ncbi:MAG TPA: BTAD domain-containing putative transcriptional regulator, partial [Thermoanaerobaculia bacterium]|nr:BTAD domain-containing putative transcriptional regulator [Thermoanaerobaculia bacterium]
MTSMRLELLGDLLIRSADGSLVTIGAKKSQALLAYLAVKPGQHVSREKLAGLLWSSTGPDQARQSLRQTLSSVRKDLSQIAPDHKLLIEESDLLSLDRSVSCDVAEMESLVAAGTEEALRKALDLYRGDFLDGFSINEERFDQFVTGERDRLHRVALRAHAQLVDLQSKRGALDEAIGTAQQSLRLDVLQEPMHRTLMRLYLQSGDVVEALQQYESCAKVLKRELRIEPDAETKALQREILQLRARRGEPDAPQLDERKKTILVVEDNVLSRELTNAVLKSAGYAVLMAKDGAEALMMVGRESVDLMVIDVDLPYIDGHSLLQAMHENGVDVPAIFLSGLPGDDVEIRAFEVGAVDFIRKPVKNNVLLARVAKVWRELG